MTTANILAKLNYGGCTSTRNPAVLNQFAPPQSSEVNTTVEGVRNRSRGSISKGDLVRQLNLSKERVQGGAPGGGQVRTALTRMLRN